MSYRWTPGVVLAILLLCGCRQNPEEISGEVTRFAGQTMGTTFSVIAPGVGAAPIALAAVDSLLRAINAEVSTYEPASMISRFNRGEALSVPLVAAGGAAHQLQAQAGSHFAHNLALTVELTAATAGYFDPTVGPLVEYYGFGAGRLDTSAVDDVEVERLRGLTGLEQIVLDTLERPAGGRLWRISARSPGTQIDFSAVAKGYAVDQVGRLLVERFGARDYFVEVGGETRALGESPRGGAWTVGINTPDPEARLSDMSLVIGISGRAVATSGNYRNVRVRGGELLVHTLDPHTGRPRSSSLLSATVVADDCATADAYATACMASAEEAPSVLAKAGLPACLIFGRDDGAYELRFVNDFESYVLQTGE